MTSNSTFLNAEFGLLEVIILNSFLTFQKRRRLHRCPNNEKGDPNQSNQNPPNGSHQKIHWRLNPVQVPSDQNPKAKWGKPWSSFAFLWKSRIIHREKGEEHKEEIGLGKIEET